MAETIDKCSLYLDAVGDAKAIIVDVYELEDAIAGAVTSQTFRPNEDVVKTNVANQVGSTTNIYQAIDESTLSTTDYISPIDSTAYDYSGRVNVGVGNLTGKRITKVSLVAVVGGLQDGGKYRPYLNLGGTKYAGTLRTIAGGSQQTITQDWVVNPATSVPWTIAEVELLDTTDEFGFDSNGQTATDDLAVFQAYVVVYSVPENRVAYGVLAGASLVVGWNEVDLLTPTGGATWSKLTTPQEYLFVVRNRATNTLPKLVRYLDGSSSLTASCPHVEHEGYLPTVMDESGRLSAIGSPLTRSYPIIITTSAPAVSADSQPYASQVAEPVYTGHNIEQEFQGTANTYGLLRLLIAQQALTAGADLLVKIKRRSDNVQLGSTLTITSADLTAPRTDFQLVTKSLSTPATLAAVQYYLEFSSTAANGAGWVVGALDTEDQGNGITFGGTTDQLTEAAVDDPSEDAQATVSTVPSAPAGFSVTDVPADCVDSAAISWTATALGASFAAYEIERDSGDGNYQQIAEITTEATTSFSDYEGKRGVTATYRMRVRRTDGATSDYTATDTATPQPTDCDYEFSSNEDPTINSCYCDRAPRRYEFPRRTQYLPLYNQDFQTAFSELEDRGDVFTVDLQLAGGRERPSATPGRETFDAILAAARAEVSYVAVLDSDGNRWFAHLDVPEGTREQPGNFYFVPLRVTEITETPSTPDA